MLLCISNVTLCFFIPFNIFLIFSRLISAVASLNKIFNLFKKLHQRISSRQSYTESQVRILSERRNTHKMIRVKKEIPSKATGHLGPMRDDARRRDARIIHHRR